MRLSPVMGGGRPLHEPRNRNVRSAHVVAAQIVVYPAMPRAPVRHPGRPNHLHATTVVGNAELRAQAPRLMELPPTAAV